MIRGTIRGTDARTVTDIPTGKQLPELRRQQAAGRLQLAGKRYP
jgi:hypothetical protein